MPRPLRLLFFASAREAVGRAQLDRTVPEEGADLHGVLRELCREFPKLEPVVRSSRLAVNGSYVRDRHSRVGPGDELAIHPPFSGG
ncbi:MAG TPA: MoaD/ThiS family protein [Thermoplasmata archaeon]|nr:MoaD/ThiS family protein [Thermoplasmata archaeon]